MDILLQNSPNPYILEGVNNTSDITKGVLALAVIIFFWVGCDLNRLSDLPNNPSAEEISPNLYIQVRTAVRPYLKNPSTASFASRSSWSYNQLEENVYSVKGAVRAENGFGGEVWTPIYAVYLFAEPADELLLEALRLGDEWIVDGYYAPFGEARPK